MVESRSRNGPLLLLQYSASSKRRVRKVRDWNENCNFFLHILHALWFFLLMCFYLFSVKTEYNLRFLGFTVSVLYNSPLMLPPSVSRLDALVVVVACRFLCFRWLCRKDRTLSVCLLARMLRLGGTLFSSDTIVKISLLLAHYLIIALIYKPNQPVVFYSKILQYEFNLWKIPIKLSDW